MSFPVPVTLMIEPTESEDIVEIERFIEAMVLIHGEIQEIVDGQISVEDCALRLAPHTAAAVVDSMWDRKYPREVGAFPTMSDGLVTGELIGARGKYWPTTGRIDGAFGDRNLVCSCAPVSSYE